MKEYLKQFAIYNQWANARLYAVALETEEAAYRRNVGAFFKSLHGTLNHLLVTDRIWMKRLTGEGDHPNELDAIIHEDRWQLAIARAEEDLRVIRYVESVDDLLLSGSVRYSTISGKVHDQCRSDVLSHLFNHQTHHRGQAHTILNMMGYDPPSLDLLGMQRGITAPDLHSIALTPMKPNVQPLQHH